MPWPGEDGGPDRLHPAGGHAPDDTGADTDELVDAELGQVIRPVPVVEPEPLPGAALRRAVIEAYDRLGDRVLQRLRTLREDVDADLTELRSELAALRQAVEDVGDRVQLRQLRSSIDDLRSDVAGLRRAVLEWPELARVSSDVTALRADVTAVLESLTPAAIAPLVEELAELRLEVASLRRRIALRAGGEPSSDG